MVQVLSTGVTPSPYHPMLWVWFDQEWTTGIVEVVAEMVATNSAIKRLPVKLRSLVLTLVRNGVIVRVQLAKPTSADGQQNSLRLQARSVATLADVPRRLREIVETLEELAGYVANKDEIERESRSERSQPGISASQHEIHQLRMRWQLALKHYLA